MSTTFYLVDKERMGVFARKAVKSINEGRIEEARKLLSSENWEVPIGHRSCGWQFKWFAHNFKYFTNKKELMDWLKTSQITDEYGEEYTFEQFINEEVGEQMYEGKDMEDFASACPSYMKYGPGYDFNGYHVNAYDEFYMDGLRMSMRD